MVKNIPPKLYKFQSFESKYSIENLRDNQIWFSKPERLNDPFDCATPTVFIDTDNEEVMANFLENFSFAKLRKEGKTELIEKLKSQHFQNGKPDQKLLIEADKLFREYSQAQIDIYRHTGVACFTTELKSILMWSHYADGHKGFCLELDTKYLSERLIEVIYSGSYPTLSPEDWYKAPHRLIEPLYTKSNDWAYENEWRFIKKKGNSVYTYNPKALTAIYFGCSASSENINKILTLPAKSAARLYQMRPSSTEFKLEYVPYHMS